MRTSRNRVRLRVVLTLLAFFLLMFVAGAAIPYACHVHDVSDARLDRLEALLRDEARRQGRTAGEIEALVREMRDHYGRQEDTDG